MDKKYLGRAVALPKETYALLLEVQEELNEKLGFKPSISETITYLAKNRKP